MIQKAVKTGNVTEDDKRKFRANAAELAGKGIVGFGEMTAEHFSMEKGHPYESAPPDHPLFLELADLAAQYGLPIDLHMEAIPHEMPMPKRLLQSSLNPQMLKPNIDSLERLLAHNRNAKIIWVHLGWDNTGKRTVEMTRKLLADNPNLYMSVRIASDRVKQNYTSPTYPLDADSKLKSDWLELFQEFPDRFIIGSDEIVNDQNDHASADSISSTIAMIDQLPDDLKKKIGYENVTNIYRLK